MYGLKVKVTWPRSNQGQIEVISHNNAEKLTPKQQIVLNFMISVGNTHEL